MNGEESFSLLSFFTLFGGSGEVLVFVSCTNGLRRFLNPSLFLFLGSVAAADSEDCVKSGRKCQKRLQSKLNGRHLTLTKTSRKHAPF